jgi:hypothetical protein
MAFTFGLSIEGPGFDGYRAAVFSMANVWKSGGKAWGVLLGDIGDYFIEKIEEEFESEGAGTGGWKPLSDKYDEWKQEYYGNEPILYLEGWYSQSFGYDWIEGGEAILIDSEYEDTIHMWHTFGTATMPERAPFIVTPADLDMVDEMFAEHFDAVGFERLLEVI